MKGSLIILILALCISSVYSDDCDFQIASVSDIALVIQNQNWGTTVTKVLCFAPGTYSFNGGNDYFIAAPQVWRGARANDDPTCNQRVNPPCERLQSAKSFDSTVESVFTVTDATQIFFEVNTASFNFSGFSVDLQSTSFPYFVFSDGGGAPVYLYNNYLKLQAAFAIDEIHAYNNYFDGVSSPLVFISTSVTTGTVQYNYFTNVGEIAFAGPTADIQHNSFVNNYQALGLESNPTVANNLFVSNFIVSNVGSSSTFNTNSFIFNNQVLYVQVDGYIMVSSDNCFVDNNFNLPIDSGATIVTDSSVGNYLGPIKLAQGNWIDAPSGLGTLASQPLSFSSPLFCPKNFFSAFVLRPHSVVVGQPIQIYWSFKTGSDLIKSGFDLSVINQTTITFWIYDGLDNPSAHSVQLSLTDTVNLDHFGVAFNTLTYTPQYADFPTSPIHATANNYTLVAHLNVNFNSAGGNPFAHTFVATENIVVQYNVPFECRNRSSVITFQKTARFNGPIVLNLTDIFCDDYNNWNITAIDRQPLHAAPLSVNSDLKSVNFTIDPTKSGLINFVVNITSVSNPTLVHRLVTHVEVINHNPTAPAPRTYNFTHWEDIQNITLLNGATDPDSDTLSVAAIHGRGTNSSQLAGEMAVYFDYPSHANSSFIVVSDLSGHLSLHHPIANTTNPNNPVIGGAFSNSDLDKFQSSFGLNYFITDGDRVHEIGTSSVTFNHVKNPSS